MTDVSLTNFHRKTRSGAGAGAGSKLKVCLFAPGPFWGSRARCARYALEAKNSCRHGWLNGDGQASPMRKASAKSASALESKVPRFI
jgi:hypothetical protein